MMKYTEFNVNKKLFGDDYLIYNWKESDEEIHIYLKSQSHTGTCPQCGQNSSNFHGTYTRTIQTVPIRMKKTYIHIIAYKYKSFFDSHRQIQINSLYDESTWEVFSVYVVDADKEKIDIDYSKEGSFMAAMGSFKKRSMFKTDTQLGSEDKIVTLVTCSYETSNSCTMVHAKHIG